MDLFRGLYILRQQISLLIRTVLFGQVKESSLCVFNELINSFIDDFLVYLVLSFDLFLVELSDLVIVILFVHEGVEASV